MNNKPDTVQFLRSEILRHKREKAVFKKENMRVKKALKIINNGHYLTGDDYKEYRATMQREIARLEKQSKK